MGEARSLTLLRKAAKTAAHPRQELVWFNEPTLIHSDCYTTPDTGSICLFRSPSSFPKNQYRRLCST